jgi:hypothetical protein
MDYEAAKLAYQNQRINAGKKRVPFDITFEQWCDIWAPHIHERGKLQLQRIEKERGYVPGNLRIAPAPGRSA